MIWWISLVILFFVTVIGYTIVPDIFLHRLGIGSWKRQYSSGVTLTFDDGPDPEYTPKILDILEREKVHGTFFIVGERAAKHPKLVKRIQTGGHQIGLHCQEHHYAWFMGPFVTWKKWDEGVATIESITGEQVEWIRPPWGTFNLVVFIWMKLRKKKAILWNVEGHDWEASRSPLQISDKIIKRTKEGTIIVLHDAGGENGAPANTVKALELICQRVQNDLKLPIVNLELPTWSTGHRIAYILWEKWEKFFARRYHIERISSSNLLRLSQTVYSGPNLYSHYGELLAQKGDIVGEIHFDNARFLSKETNIQKIGLRVLRQIKPSLAEMAAFVSQNEKYRHLKVFIGVSLINRGVTGLGFHVVDLPITLGSKLIGKIQRTILRIYHPSGKKRSVMLNKEHPKLIWMSRDTLIQKWLTYKKKDVINR